MVCRYFKRPIHNLLVEMVINRVKNMLGYPESASDLVTPLSVLYRSGDWAMGRERSFDEYMRMVGLDPVTKTERPNVWCRRGEWPEEAKPYYVKK